VRFLPSHTLAIVAALHDSHADRFVIRQKMNRMDELLYREEMMWLQRSRISWLKEGDRNTKFFHKKAVWRAKKNEIKKLKKDDGTWCTVPSTMERMTTSYFKEVYTKDPTLNPDDIVEVLAPKVSAAMTDGLCKEFSRPKFQMLCFK
jgi:hypothetical protein